MKKVFVPRIPVIVSVGLLVCAIAAQGQTASDSAAQSAYNSGWPNGSNGGYGYYPWNLVNNNGEGGGFAGAFIGSSGVAAIDTSGKAFGMYANGGSYNYSVGYRGFTNSLPVGQVFTLKFKNQSIASGQAVGWSLQTGTNAASAQDINTIAGGSRFSFYFLGGSSDYYIWDGNSVSISSVPYTSGGLTLEFALRSADTYRLVVKTADGGTTLASYDGQPLQGSGTIDSFICYNLNAGSGGDIHFNQFQVTPTSLVPPEIQNVAPTSGSIYLDGGSTTVSFDVTSAFSTVAMNAITLSLDGQNQTNLAFSGSPTSWHVTLNSPISNNVAYSGVIIAVDANGNHATNTFTFNTWTADNPFIEAEDYNYSSGRFLNNIFPDSYNAYQGLRGSNGVDYLEYDLTGTNHPNAYRTNDLPQAELASDVDHANYSGLGYTDYNLGFTANGEWENYTRNMGPVGMTNYWVYARMAGFGSAPVMQFERLANPTATNNVQPRATLGTFVCPSDTGGPQSYAFVQLKDFFSAPVAVRFPNTNTFRCTCIGNDGSYNFSYLIFVPFTTTNTLRPYITSGFPYPGAAGVAPDRQTITFTIANRQTPVSPGSIQLFVNSNNVTSGIVLSNNTAGTVVNYSPTSLLPAGTNTLQVIFNDGSISQTNQWQFTVANLQVIPPAYAQPIGTGASNGFSIHIYKVDDTADPSLFTSIFTGEAELIGAIINTNNSLPYPNLAGGPKGDGRYLEPGAINYDITGTNNGSTFPTKSPFPYVPAEGTNNFIAMEAFAYLQLSPGAYTFAVRSDDGFRQTVGPTVCNTNFVLAEYILDRGNGTPSTYQFIVQTNGLYPVRLLYWQGRFGGNVEFYSINRTNGVATLINDPGNPAAIKAYPTLKTTLTEIARTGRTNVFSFKTEGCRTHRVEFKNSLTSPTWLFLTNVSGTGNSATITDTTATNSTRFYRAGTQ
jgi:hypothetical protein